ncbi:glycosyltransferase family 4 protein [Niallia taxi]|uniref:glycosyltransferase family 4 protein n=1 Tax=Niallia taxi TaxID=2499688 RepID=UPI0030096E2D
MEKILVIEQGGNGGVCHYTYELINALSENEVSVGLFTSNDYELIDSPRNFQLYNKIYWSRNKVLKKLKINKVLNILYYLISLFSLYKIIKKEKYNTVHIQGLYFLPLNVLTLRIAKMMKCKIIFTPHNTFPRYNKEYLNNYFQLMFRYSNKIIVHSEFDFNRLVNSYKINEKKISVIPHGNFGIFSRVEQNVKPITSKKKKVVLFFGYIRSDKGLEYLIDGFADFLRDVSNKEEYILNIVGRPEGKFDKYQAKIDKNKIKSSVNCTLGYIPFEEVGEYFRNSDVIVLPYLEISQSGILQIAMAYGKAIIVSNVGGLPEIITDGKNGYVVEPKSAVQISEALKKAFGNYDRLLEMGKLNKRLSETDFSWGSIAKKTLDLYRSGDY